MADTFCALCGVPFDMTNVYDDSFHSEEFEWMRSYRVVKRLPNSSQWYISKPVTGLNLQGTGYAPPADEDNATQVDGPHEHNFVSFSPRETNLDIAYPIHSCCYQILEQTFTEYSNGPSLNPNDLGKFLSSQNLAGMGRGLVPAWSNIGYGGAEQFWRDSWRWMEDPDCLDEYDYRPCSWDFLVCDPESLNYFKEIGPWTASLGQLYLKIIPPQLVLSQPEPSTLTIKMAERSKSGCGDGDIFASLSFEVLELILVLLPTPSVLALRLSSPSIAWHGLSKRFWESRFQYPHELSYLPRDSIASPPEGTSIDWKKFRRMILRPADDTLLSFDKLDWSRRNRKRIARIIEQFSIALLERIAKDNKTSPIWLEDPFAKSIYHRKTLSSGVSLITSRDRLIFPVTFELEHIAVVVVCSEQVRRERRDGVVDGIEFRDKNRKMIGYLGRFYGDEHSDVTGHQTHYHLQNGDTFVGLVTSMSYEGFIDMQPMLSKQGITNEIEMVKSLTYRNDDREVKAISLSPGARLYGLEATFLGDWMTSLTMIEIIPEMNDYEAHSYT